MTNNISSQQIRADERNHFTHGISSTAFYTDLVIDHGLGSYLYDVNGKAYIDLFAGPAIASLGHAHQSFTQAVSQQLQKMVVGSYTTVIRSQYLSLLASLLPSVLSQYSFYSSGTEANEIALKLARNYKGKTQIVSFWGGYHGKTLGALSVSDPNYADTSVELVGGVIRTPFPDGYRRLVDITDDEEYGNWFINFIRTAIKKHTVEGIAAIIVEPIQGTAGNVIPVKGFLKKLRSLCDEMDCLLILDEVITGFGRTGSLFYFEQEDIIPDIVVVGKGMGNGIPISAVITREDIISKQPLAKPSGLSSSFGGNPLSLAAALVTLQLILSEKLIENTKVVGEYFLEKLLKEFGDLPFIGDIRGKGLMIGIELVNNKVRKDPLDMSLITDFSNNTINAGLLGSFRTSHLRINPPLIFSKSEVDSTIEKLQTCFLILLKQYNG